MRRIVLLILTALTLTAFGCTLNPQDEQTGAKTDVTDAETQAQTAVQTNAETAEQEKQMDDLLSDGECDNGGGWSAFGGVFKTEKSFYRSKEACAGITSRQNEWDSPAFDLYPVISKNGAGVYIFSCYVMPVGLEKTGVLSFGVCIRGNGKADENSFIKNNSENYYARLNSYEGTFDGDWLYIERSFTVTEADLDGKNHKWNFCFDMFTTDADGIFVDDCSLINISKTNDETEQSIPQSCECWRSTEIVLISEKEYGNPFYDVVLDLNITNGTLSYTVPGFWDGGRVFKIRYRLPSDGIWTFTTVCNKNDAGLNGITGKVTCREYSGTLDIYKHGFVRTDKNLRYFVYDDSTPFFYLGDTHWNMPAEEYYTAGTDGTNAKSHFKYIVDERVKQGFTVYQSEPIGASYNLADGFTVNDIQGFYELDLKFKYIANAGLVHANAELFFTSELAGNAAKYSDEYLELLTRYWVARYGSYPVLWTLAQECDDDFYFDRGDQKVFNAENNPWKKVLSYIVKYDAFASPASAHMEYASMSNTGGVNATRSAFAGLKGHSWFAVQWSPALNGKTDFALAENFWQNSMGKPAINYEGRYENLWTKNFGARAQGWISYLNGMYGYGYGAVDIWLYNSQYDIDTTSNDGVDSITPADKAVSWTESVHFKTAEQLGYMKKFFTDVGWNTLTPRFDSSEFIRAQRTVNYALATKDNDVYVLYLFNQTKDSPILLGMKNTAYTLQWFNTRTGEYSDSISVTPEDGRLTLPDKPDKNDWAAYIKLAG